MRIALVAPLYECVPPVLYGGTERVIAALADELVDAGHDVVLFAAAGSATKARLVPCAPKPLRMTMTRTELEHIAPHLHLSMLAEVYRRSDEFDIIHAHTDVWTLPFIERTSTPTVVTLHGRLDLDIVRTVLPKYPGVPLVSISDSQREPVADLDLRWAATCYNGLDLSRYRSAVTESPGDHVVFLGRITPEKRPDWAIEVARRAGRRLVIAAKVDPLDQDYFRDEIEPLIESSPDVEFIGEISEDQKPEFFADAAAMLFPIDWPEPFGLVMIESMAAGAPVIALRNGSVPEVVTAGVSGAICDDLDDMVRAVDRVSEFDRAAVSDAAQRFSARAMAAAYVECYEQLSTPLGLARAMDVDELPSTTLV